MEQQAEDIQIIAHQHASGEVFVAENVEVARGMCPVLGKMSLEEVGLLLELQSIGQEQINISQDVPVERQATPKPEQEKHQQSDSSPTVDAVQHEDEVTLRTAQEITELPLEAYLRELSDKDAVMSIEPAISDAPEAETKTVLSPKETTKLAELPKPTDDRLSGNQSLPAIENQPTIHSVLAVENEISLRQPITKNEEVEIDETAEVRVSLLEETTVAEYVSLPQEASIDSTAFTDQIIEYVSGAEYNTLSATEIVFAEVAATDTDPELEVPLEQVENAITRLTEVLDQPDPESSKAVQLMEQITTIPEALSLATPEAEKLAAQQLEVLFTELFEELDIEYSPELIQAFVALTQAHHFEFMLRVARSAESEEEGEELPKKIDTREFLHYIQRSMKVVKRGVIKFIEIGKSVLRLSGVAQAASIV